MIPGRDFNISISSPFKLSAYPGTSGRGPTKLISPTNTFHNSGNSSNLYFRRNAPKGVIRLSPATDTDDPPCPTFILRNLYIVNTSPFSPTRFCLNNAGPSGIFTRIIPHTTSNTGQRHNKPIRAIMRSKINLTILDTILKKVT